MIFICVKSAVGVEAMHRKVGLLLILHVDCYLFQDDDRTNDSPPPLGAASLTLASAIKMMVP